MTTKNLSCSSHRSPHGWDPAQQCTRHCGVHHLFGLPFALTTWRLGPMSATVTINAVQPRRATRERQRQTLRDASHQAERGQELQLENYSQHPLTLHFIHSGGSIRTSNYSSTFVMQFRCPHIKLMKVARDAKEGAVDEKIILCKAVGFDWFTCYTSKFVFHF